MKLKHRIEVLAQLGEHLLGEDEYLEAVMERTKYHNPWFTVENQKGAVEAIATSFLQKEKLLDWVAQYDLEEPESPKWVGLIMAGNIPLVGFHDLLCIFITGHRTRMKLSDKDKFLLPYLLQLLEKFSPETKPYFEVVERMSEIDAVIATGSNNSSRYFEAYFGQYPNIIRKNRNAIAVLSGNESDEELHDLGKDVFRFFGLGCRNVSKIFLPEGYHLSPLLEQLHDYRDIIMHHKYKNNFDYNLAMVMMNRTTYWNNGCVIMTENESIASRIAMLHFEHYSDREELEDKLLSCRAEIQCVVAQSPIKDLPTVNFGQAQSPNLDDFPDGVDVVKFLSDLK